jgi:hypothetical protein
MCIAQAPLRAVCGDTTTSRNAMDTFLAIALGIGLSAASGFRLFVPLLGLSIAVLSGYLEPAEGFAWIGTWPALIAFAVATVLEIGVYYIPWLDNAMDTLATPLAFVAGSVLAASVMVDLPSFVQWMLAIIAGGGAAGIVQLGTTALRGKSSVTTAGMGNFVVSSFELLGAVLTTALAILLPLICLALVIWLLIILARRVWKTSTQRRPRRQKMEG